ncbi:MAG TPA: hypothetical protein P5526_17085, partial [Anaerolineae bacterium]|nr:hypothetical protein [Anaerolineae bacterium]
CKTGSTDSSSSDYGAGGAGIGCTQVLSPTNQLNNDLFHDKDPIRTEKEGVKYLANLLDPAIDQLGLVAFSNNVYNGTTHGIQQRAELQCLRWAAENDPQGVLKCFDPATNPISFTQVIKSVEIHDNTGGTNISEGLREGLEELGIEAGNNTGIDSNCSPGINDKSVCDRQGTARRVLILLTDGVPNDDDNCPASNLWMGEHGQGSQDYDCAIYYAQQAANQNVSLFTIGLGPGFDPDLLAAMATGVDPTTGDVYFAPRCGQFFAVPRANDLDLVFEGIVEAARNCTTPVSALALTKSGPATAVAGQPILYTLTLTNTLGLTINNVRITDTLPVGANYVSGGTRVGNVVSWTLASLAAHDTVQTSFIVTATQTITNADYGVTSGDGFRTTGTQSVTTVIDTGGEPSLGNRYYIPVIFK